MGGSTTILALIVAVASALVAFGSLIMSHREVEVMRQQLDEYRNERAETRRAHREAKLTADYLREEGGQGREQCTIEVANRSEAPAWHVYAFLGDENGRPLSDEASYGLLAPHEAKVRTLHAPASAWDAPSDVLIWMLWKDDSSHDMAHLEPSSLRDFLR